MNSPSYIGNAISEYSIAKKDIVSGIPDVAEEYDKLSVVVICLNRKVEDREINELIGMLNTVFDEKLDAEAKKQILSREYDMVVGREVEEVMGHMCNLGEGIYENGREEGRREGWLKEIANIRSNLLKGRSVEIIADFFNIDIKVVCKLSELIEGNADVTDEELLDLYYKSSIKL